MKVKDLRDLLKNVNGESEVRPYVKDLDSKIQFWYFDIEDIDVKEDGVYLELR